MKQFDELVAALELCKPDAEKFDKGNQSAGVRLRKGLKEVIKLAKEIVRPRVEVGKDV